MLDLVDEQYEKMEQNHPGVGIVEYGAKHRSGSSLTFPKSYLVLSGGLGSSAYVKQRLESRFGVAGDSMRHNAQKTTIIVVFEPYVGNDLTI